MKRSASLALALALSLTPLAASAQLTLSGQVAVGTPVYANMAPPPPRAENPGPSPGADSAWVGGFWNWTGVQHQWVNGRWDRLPQGAQAWEAPQWEQEGQRYRFRPGRWGHRGAMGPNPTAVMAPPAAPQVVFANTPPPRMRMERRPPREQQGQRWVTGAWQWNGSQYTWVGGHWEMPPRQNAQWMGPQWRRRGRQWESVPGRWR